MEKALQTLLYLSISYLHVASQTVLLQGLPLCRTPWLALHRSTGMSWVDGDSGVGTRDVRHPRGAQHRSPAKAAVGAWDRSGACLGKD